MPERTPASLVKPGTRNSSKSPVELLVHTHPPTPPSDPGRGVPVMTVERKDTPEGFRSEIAFFTCTCNPPLACMAPLPKPRSAKQRRQRRRELASGTAQPAWRERAEVRVGGAG